MAAQNFKKSFRIEVVQLARSNLVGLWVPWAYGLSQNFETFRPEMELWRIFERRSEKVVFANWAVRDLRNRKWYQHADCFVRRRGPSSMWLAHNMCQKYFHFRSENSQSQKSQNVIFLKHGHLRSHATTKPEVVLIRSFRSLTVDGHLQSAQQTARRYSFKRIYGDFSNLVNLVITCPTSSTSADLTGLLWDWRSWEIAHSTEDDHAHNISETQQN